MKDILVEIPDIVIEVEPPITNPVTVINVNDEIVPEPKKIVLPSIFGLEKRVLTGTFLLIMLIVPTVGGGYLSYLLRREMYEPVLLEDKFPLVGYEASLPTRVSTDQIIEEEPESESEDEEDF